MERKPEVTKWRVILNNYSASTNYLGHRDCDLDLGDIALQLRLDRLDHLDRFMVYEEAHDWVMALGKRDKQNDLSNCVISFDIGDFHPTALDDLKVSLRLH
jgi:hypothetical protein